MKLYFSVIALLLNTSVVLAANPGIEWFTITSPSERVNQQAHLSWNVRGGQSATITIGCEPGTIRFLDAGSRHIFDCGDALNYSSADGAYALAIEPRDNAGWATAAFTLTVGNNNGGVIDERTFSLGFQGSGLARDLYKGMRGNQGVLLLQKLLTVAGFYSGPVNGNFFSMTENAVKKFQKANGIKPTGFVGPITRSALNK